MQRILYFAIVLVVFFTFINALVFFGLGIYYSIVAYLDIVYGRWENHPGVILVESLDRFLFGFVFIIFSIGLARLFLPDATFLKSYELPWLKLTDFFSVEDAFNIGHPCCSFCGMGASGYFDYAT